MALNQALLGEFDHEMANTRKTLERVPDGKFDWKPHAKSYSMGQLAGHIAFIPHWATVTIEKPEFDVNPAGGAAVQRPPMETQAGVLAFFDKGVAEARAALAATNDQKLMTPWSLLNGGKAMFTMPRIAVLRGFVMNHMIHHRAQLGVYLRMNDVPVPAIYGPSADDNPMGM
jgi:uncharacterized damage-inducible protein DinB